MKSIDWGNSLHKLLFHAQVYELLRDKYPEFINQVCEMLHREYEKKEVKDFIQEIRVSAKQTISEFEKLFLVDDVPKLDEKHIDLFKDVMQLAHANSLPIPGGMANKKPVRIYLEGCWDLMHSGHYNAIRQVLAIA
jgi:hypothetical protein